MNQPASLDRRHFIRLSALAAAVVIIPRMAACRAKLPIPAGTDRPDLLSHVTDKAAIRKIGKAYITAHPDEANADTLYEKIMKGHPGSSPMTTDELTAYLNNAVAADFTNDRLVVASGWVVSVTEARQCALFEITNRGSRIEDRGSTA